ncbi:MAG TPA: porin, partial [Longimicrobium sp.]|nr:porin [Longimicrobium sp.]
MPAPRTPLIALSLSLSLSLPAAPAAAQGFTILGPDSSRLTFNGRIQTQFNTSSDDDVPQSETALRRVRLESTFQLNRMVSGKISPEFAGSRVSIRDAYVRFALDPALVVWAGQAYRPFSAMTMYSSSRMLPIERGVRIRGLSDEYDQWNLVSGLGYGDRDVGLQLRGEPKGAPLGLSYAVGWFNGPARAEFPNENTGQVVARVGIAPAPNLKLNASYSARDFAAGGDAVEVERGDAWEADVEIGSERGGLHVLGEVVAGDFD